MNVMVVIYHKDHEAVKLNNKGKCIINHCVRLTFARNVFCLEETVKYQ